MAGYIYLHNTVPVSVNAALSNSGDAQFVYATKQQETYSPACGCLADKSERWRGITFSARRMQIANTTETRQTAFWIMPAEPTKLDWSPTLFSHRVRMLRLSIDAKKVLRSADFLNIERTAGVKIRDDRALGPDYVEALITTKPLTALLPGSYPIAAYVPVENSRVSLIQPNSTFADGQTFPLLREEYGATAAQIGHRGGIITGAESLAYPMIDLLGAQTILITDDPGAYLVARDYEGPLNGPAGPDGKNVTAFIISSPFSTRLSAMPIGTITPTAHLHPPALSTDLHSDFIEPDKPGRPVEPDEVVINIGRGPIWLPTDVVPRRNGVLEVTLVEPLSKAEYADLAESLRKSDITWAYDIRGRVPEIDHINMDFRYPPIPPIDGFNIFGLLAELTLHVKSGHLMIGAADIPIEAPSVIKFSDIRAFTPKHNVIPIPLAVGTRDQVLDFSLEATSKLSLNGTPVRVEADRKRTYIEYTVILAALIQGIAAGLSLRRRNAPES